jgi:hypothetical protein
VLGVSGRDPAAAGRHPVRPVAGFIGRPADFELLTDTFILTYRYVPAHLRQRMDALLAGGQAEQPPN